ncbi:MAG: hypothetical protein R2705_14890 [Ilumatobacteraceae bacterium]
METRLAALEDEMDTEVSGLEERLNQTQATSAELEATLAERDAALAAAQDAADAASADATAKQNQIDDLTTQLDEAQAAAASVAGVFPVQLEDLNKLDMTVLGMPLTSRSTECSYSQDTCAALGASRLDADIYLDNSVWNITVRDRNVPYFQAKLVLDETGSFSGSEYVNAEGTCADGSSSKPFATIYVNPVEFTVADGKLRATRFRGYLRDSMECGDTDPYSSLAFEGRLP